LQVEIPDQFIYQSEPLLMGLSFAMVKAVRATSGLQDRDLIAALSALCTNYERRTNSGLYYEQPLPTAQHAVAAEIETMLKQYREVEQKHSGSSLRDSDALKALVFLTRMAYGRTSGRPKSRAFIDFLVAQFPANESASIGSQDSRNRLIVP
jgi:hypothetical protein